MPGDDPMLDLVLYHTPNFYTWIVWWYYLAPAAAVIVGGLVLISVWRVWFSSWGVGMPNIGMLPMWPLNPQKDAGPAIVVGEVHHPVKAVESRNPKWLIIPERGLYTGVAIFGAVGSGKTSACMHPFAQQILSWQAGDPQRRAAGLVLEVKGDFCHDIRQILAVAGREEDYIELGMEGRWQWNPLSAEWLDSYSLAYTVSSLLNQLFGKGKEPFWQQAYTNLVRWIIELYRVFPGQWVTLQQVYHCAIDKELFAAKIQEAEAYVRDLREGTVFISTKDFLPNMDLLADVGNWVPIEQENKFHAPHKPAVETRLKELQIDYRIEWTESVRAEEIRQRVEAVNRWYQHDWQMIDNKIRSSIVEGISVFLSIFDLPDVARVFCPPPPPEKAAANGNGEPKQDEQPGLGTRVRQSLPPLDKLIESGKVLALNMPAGSNPALARAVGVMLKNAWLQSLLRRPAQMKKAPDQYFRPAVFICDEYQAFASVGEDDPSGDEKSFALTRQCRCIPIVATQSISSLRSVLGSSEAWRTLLQTLRTRIFLSLSDDASAQTASALCGQVAKIKPSYTITESSKQSEVSMLSAQAGGIAGSVGASKSFREQREAVFQPREFSLLSNCQAICLPYDGARSLPATRVYLKPHYLPRSLPYWRAKAEGKI